MKSIDSPVIRHLFISFHNASADGHSSYSVNIDPSFIITPQDAFDATERIQLRIVPPDRDPSARDFRSVYGIERHMGGYNHSW